MKKWQNIVVPGIYALRVLEEALRRWFGHRTWLYAGSVAFYAVLSALPVLLLGLYVLGWFVGVGPAREILLSSLRATFGEEGWELAQGFLSVPRLAGPSGNLLSSFIFLLSLVLGATRFGVALRYALESLWIPPDHLRKYGFFGWISTRLRSLLLVLAGETVLFVVPSLGFLLEELREFLHLLFQGTPVLSLLPLLLLVMDTLGGFVLVASMLWGIYYGIPRFSVSPGEALAGALVGSGIFTLGKHAVFLMISRSLFSSLYGIVGMFMLFLLWIYFMAQVTLFGAQYARAWGELHKKIFPFPDKEDAKWTRKK